MNIFNKTFAKMIVSANKTKEERKSEQFKKQIKELKEILNYTIKDKRYEACDYVSEIKIYYRPSPECHFLTDTITITKQRRLFCFSKFKCDHSMFSFTQLIKYINREYNQKVKNS